MKNIHILPTDKPSRLISDGDELMFLYEVNYDIHNWGINRHIYITSDEEIKEGDWYLDTFNTQRIKANQFSDHKHYGNACKKIILTTDPDLIQYNVQAIDDKFLEWFVKNPSCEEVDVANSLVRISSFDWRTDYKIIIPKEEPKQEFPQFGTKEFNDLASTYFGGKPKQETLEEFIKKQLSLGKYQDQESAIRHSIELGAKWQQEQDKKLYSEEEVIKIAKQYAKRCQAPIQDSKWFEQFKKK